MENKPKSLLGTLFEQVRVKREQLRNAAVKDLYDRNKITKVSPGYRLESERYIDREGMEVFEYRLYKVVDCSVTRLRVTPESQVRTGLSAIDEKRR